MSDTVQPAAFAFNADSATQAAKIVQRYPQGRQQSAVMPLLDLAQRQNGGWLPEVAIRYVAEYLSMPLFAGIGVGETSSDGMFTLREVECLAACVNAPLMQIGDDYYEDLDAASTVRILEAFARDEVPKPGPQNGRQSSAPIGGPTTLKSIGQAGE